MHQNLVFNAPGSIGGQLNILFQAVSTDGFDETDGADGDQVFQIGTGAFKPPGDIDHKAQIVLDEGLFCLFIAPFQRFQSRQFLLSFQGWGQNIAATDVIKIPGGNQTQPYQNVSEFFDHAIPPVNA